MKKIFVFFIFFILFSCQDSSKPYTIAVDKNFYSITLDGQRSNLNGFINDLLLEIAKIKKIEISLVDANFDNIYDNLYKGKYDAIFSSIDPYNFNLAKYDFSKDVLKTGFALVLPINSKSKSLDELTNTHIGYIKGSQSVYILQKYLNIFIEGYDSIPQMLDDIVSMQLEGALVPVLLANKYVFDLYQNDLKISFPLLDDESIKIITIKDKNKAFLKLFDSALDKLAKNHTLDNLKKKWGFAF
jgi:ABC-type amino acid transport substrate-binding protein